MNMTRSTDWAKETAIEHLESRGYVLTDDDTWIRPEGIDPSGADLSAIAFLVQECDFGGIVGNYK
jgi:hypothetical protein